LVVVGSESDWNLSGASDIFSYNGSDEYDDDDDDDDAVSEEGDVQVIER